MGRFPPRRPLLLALSFGLAAAPGLGCGDLDLPAGAIACGADQSCPRGLECIEGICGGPASGGGGDPDAGAADAALPTNIVFVTSTQHVAQDLGGLEGADRICADRAAAAGLPGTYVAWLSTRTVDARDRLAGARGWVRPDGRPFADTVEDLVAGRIFYAPSVTEMGEELEEVAGVFTATSAEGTLEGNTCQDFTGAEGGGLYGGYAQATTRMFTRAIAFAQCTSDAHLYCFGIDHDSPVSVTPESGRRAFLSTPWLPGDGLASADAHCQTNADDAGLGGSFRALLAQTGVSAASRFDLDGAPWVRLDGVRLATTPAALMAGDLESSLNVLADGSYQAAKAWTGVAGENGPTDPGSGTQSCGDWQLTGTEDFGGIADAPKAFDGFFTGIVRYRCDGSNGAASLYCLEE